VPPHRRKSYGLWLIFCASSIPAITTRAFSKDWNPSIGFTRLFTSVVLLNDMIEVSAGPNAHLLTENLAALLELLHGPVPSCIGIQRNREWISVLLPRAGENVGAAPTSRRWRRKQSTLLPF
jgi:hypothetical protein